MTVSAIDPFVITTGNGVTATFPFGFASLDESFVFGLVNSELDNNTTVVLNGDQENDPGGTLTFSSTPESDSTIVIYRQTEATQEVVYPSKGRFPAKSHERALDKLTMLVQDFGLSISARALRVPEEEIFVETIPPIAERANLLLGFDSSGKPVATVGTQGEKGEAGLSPYISDGTDGFTSGNWIADLNGDGVFEDTGVGAAGLPPYISDGTDGFTAGNWIADENGDGSYEDTGVNAAGGAQGGGGDRVFYENDTNVTADYTITAGKNAMSAGPITIDGGVTVTVPTGSEWTVVGGS